MGEYGRWKEFVCKGHLPGDETEVAKCEGVGHSGGGPAAGDYLRHDMSHDVAFVPNLQRAK